MHYFYNERYLLPLSHDEVVHGKAAILQKMSGDYADKFPQARALYLYMYAHPGKKLNFMGNELGQLREWDEKREQDWMLLTYPIHDAFHHFMRDLALLYLKNPALSQRDYRHDGFLWLDCRAEACCVYAFERICESQRILTVFNFSDSECADYRLNIAGAKKLRLLIDTDQDCYGGVQTQSPDRREAKIREGQALFCLPPYSGRYYEIVT